MRRRSDFYDTGAGTTRGDVLDYLGVEAAEKTVFGGIAFTISLSSIGGKKTLQFLLAKDEYQKEEESVLKDTTHDLIIVIANRGYIDLVMDSAREAVPMVARCFRPKAPAWNRRTAS